MGKYSLKDHHHFKYRVAYAKYAGKLHGFLSQDVSKSMFQQLLVLTADKVPNVRIVATNNLAAIAKNSKQLSSVSSAQVRL